MRFRTCFLHAGDTRLTVLRMVLLHEAARLPTAALLVKGGPLEVGDGPFRLTLRDDSGASIDALDGSAWYVDEATRLPSPSIESDEQWMLRLGVLPAQAAPMRALVSEGQPALDVLKEVCERRERIDVGWVGEPFSHRLGTVISVGETVEGFLRRFASSLNCWFVFTGQAGLRWTQQGFGCLAEQRAPHAVPEAALLKIAAPSEVRAFWSMSLADTRFDGRAAQAPRAHEVVQATDAHMPEALTQWHRPSEWVLRYGLSDNVEDFAVRAGQSIGIKERSAVAVMHVWNANDGGAGAMRDAFDGTVGGLLPRHLEHFLSEDAGYALLTLAVDDAPDLRYLDGALLLERRNLRDAAQAVAARLGLGGAGWCPPSPRAAGGPMPATVVDPDGGNVLKESDYAALRAAQAPQARSARIKVRFDWHEQAVEIPYATPWNGAGGALFFPPRAGDRVLVGFVNGDLSAPAMVAALPCAQAAVPAAFQSPGEAFHAAQPQGISARDGLVLETTESGDLVLYAKKGNLVLRARDTVVLQGRGLTECFARSSSSGRHYDREE